MLNSSEASSQHSEMAELLTSKDPFFLSRDEDDDLGPDVLSGDENDEENVQWKNEDDTKASTGGVRQTFCLQ